MSHLENWISAARAIGVSIIGPCSIHLSDAEIDAELIFPDFGPRNGMIIISSYEAIRGLRSAILDAGYGYSAFRPESPSFSYSTEDLENMLRDWKWNGPSISEPIWL